MTEPMPAENTFDHLRDVDGEHVGYLHLDSDGKFVPYDLLQRRRAAGLELDEAEQLLNDLGLRFLLQDWWLEIDGEHHKVLIREVHRDRVSVSFEVAGAIAKSADMSAAIEVPLPTQRLVGPEHFQ